ncbi:peptidase [Spongiactinospora rosea]|uniref:alpha-amylase n=1 Tax=Spongiactinospora rosea TaxID=2248750 RepID=A0A366LZW9_9ACTN|nr:S8 family serine peptidase [Spongiactinospora rosea]RBQ18899.1 peptidase [Spongiactinospora rosea]
MFHRSPHRTRPRMIPGALAGLLAVVTLMVPQATAHAEPENSKIAAAVRTDLKDGKAAFFVRLKGEANLTAARTATTKAAKGKAVYDAKNTYAAKSQARLRKLLTERKAEHEPFWIVNTVKVTAGADLAREIAGLPEVAAIEPIGRAEVPKPRTGKARPRVTTADDPVEWNIDRIKAPQVWDELGDRGEGIVVATIDSGVDFEHPALAAQYRGRHPDGSVDHNYNWFDTYRGCLDPAPCDPTAHGTHVTGIMAGANGIGVAPGVRWISAKGCDPNCPADKLIRAGQWLVAPTDLNGQNPRPDLAPDIVNNSWRLNRFDDWYKGVTSAWAAAGIFATFGSGNDGAVCGNTATPPGYVDTYSAGAFDVNGVIAGFSSRGPGENGEIKPNIAAPGVDVRSSVPNGEYRSEEGTSQASPHVAGTVALLWSAAPSLRGDIAATRALLDGGAIDTADLSCGGTAADNNVYGEGRLDAYAAVQAAPDDPLGTLSGTVTSNGSPVSGAEVTVTGPLRRTAASGADGAYSMPRLPPGNYQVAVTRFGYQSATSTVTITDGQTTTANLTPVRLPHATITGTVTAGGTPEKDATITSPGTPVKTVTDATGHYSIEVPHGSHTLKIAGASNCVNAGTTQITVTGNMTKNIDLTRRTDDFGHTCAVGTEPYVAGTTKITIPIGEGAKLALPFPVPLYGTTYSDIWVSEDGFVSFVPSFNSVDNGPLPDIDNDLAVYAFWDELFIDDQSGVYTSTVGTAPHRSFVIEWRNVAFTQPANELRSSISALLGEDGTISYRYKDIGPAVEQGSSATIGIENADGTDALQYSFDTPSIRDGQSLTFTAKDFGVVRGKVTDANDGQPLAGATVEFPHVATFTTAADGTYGGQVRAGNHQVKVSKQTYGTLTQNLTVPATDVTTNDAALITGKVTAAPTSLTLNGTTSATITLTNSGTAPTPYEVTTEDAWLSVSPATGGLLQNQSATITVTAASPGPHTGKLLVHSASGRQPTIEIPVTVTP